MINSGDMLNDILIRNPATGILPSVTDFVLIQKRGGGFDIKDPVAEGYTIPTTLTDITSKATVVDINGDGVKDLVLTGLDSGTATITGADDQVVYGNHYERYSIPEKHIALTATKKKFFEDLSAWIENANYFEVDVPVSTTLDIDKAENTDEIQNRDYTPDGFSIFGIVNLTDLFLQQNTNNCIGLSPVLCYMLSSDGFSGGSDPFLLDNIHIAASGGRTIRFSAAPGATNRPTTVNIYDTSGFDQEARMLARYYLQPIRDSGSLVPGAANSTVISEMLEVVLEVPVLNKRLLGVGNGVLPKVEDHTSYSGITSQALESVGFPRERLTLPTPQNQVTEEERSSSPNRDVLEGLPACAFPASCVKDDFLEEQIDIVNSRLEELHDELKRVTYATSNDAAIAIHKSDLYEFSRQVGIEVLVTIDNTSTPVKLDGVYTDFNSGNVGIPRDSIGKDLWHNHPNALQVWQGDAASYVNRFGEDLCEENGDFTVYASGAILSKADIKQVIGITDTASYQFMYNEWSEPRNTWDTRTSPFSDAAVAVKVICP